MAERGNFLRSCLKSIEFEAFWPGGQSERFAGGGCEFLLKVDRGLIVPAKLRSE